jgi:predicted nucleotidyltransferase
MVDPRCILKFTDELARRFQPQKIILFGSYAYGTPTDDSDVDLLVVKPYRGESYREAARLCEGTSRSFPLDLMVKSPAEFARRIAMNDSFIMEMVTEGIVLHDLSNQRVGQQGRRRLRRRFGSAAITKTTAL